MRAIAGAVVLCSLTASSADAQGPLGFFPAAGPQAGSWEIGGGIAYLEGYDLGDRAAELTRNVGQTDRSFDLFTTDSRVTGVPALQARIGYYLTPAVAIEAGFRYAQPVLEVDITGDTESAPDLTADETLSQYVVDGSLVLHLTQWSFGGGRGVPFLAAGAGYLRELHEGEELVETGTVYHASAGAKYWFGDGRTRVGFRGEGGVVFRNGGFDFEDGVRAGPIAGASLVFLF